MNPTTNFQELKQLSILALPIAIGQLAQTANGVVDTIMSGHYSANDLAGVAVGTSFWVPVFLFITGFSIANTSLTAQMVGAQHLQKIPSHTMQAIYIHSLLGLFGFLLLYLSAAALPRLNIDPAILPVTQGYVRAISWGIPGISFYLALRSYTEGLSLTYPNMVFSVAGLLLNIPINYMLIYGRWGAPALGGVGCGYATSIVMWLMAIGMLIFVSLHKRFAVTRPFQGSLSININSFTAIARLGFPIAGSVFVEVSLFCLIALMLSRMGAVVVASHQVALNFASLIFMIPLSLSIALTIRIATGVGRQNLAEIRQSTRVGIALPTIIALLSASALATFNLQIPRIYSSDPDVISMAGSLLYFAAIFQISDALQVSANGALRGLKDTKGPMYITLIAYWLFALPLGYWLAFSNQFVPAMGAKGFWIAIITGLTIAAILLNWRLHLRLRKLGNKGFAFLK